MSAQLQSAVGRRGVEQLLEIAADASDTRLKVRSFELRAARPRFINQSAARFGGGIIAPALRRLMLPLDLSEIAPPVS